MAPYNAPQSDTYNIPSPADSDSNPMPKRIKYDSNYENMIFRAGYTNMHNEYIYNLQRKHALKMQDDRYSITSTTSSMLSSMDGYPSTPSPDFALSLSQASSPLFTGYTQSPVEPPPLRYFQSEVQLPAAVDKNPAEHNYAVDTPQGSPAAARSISHTPEPDERPVRARVASDSGNSTIPEPDEINPLCMNDWFRDALKPELAAKLTQALTTIESKSAQQKEQYLAMRVSELPTDLEIISSLRVDHDLVRLLVDTGEKALNRRVSSRTRRSSASFRN